MPISLGASFAQGFEKPLTSIPFVFHGQENSRPDVGKSPIEDLVATNLDHYRLNIDPELRSSLGSAPALGCSFPRPRGKPARHEVIRGSTTGGHAPKAGCEGASSHTRGRVRSPDF